MSDNTLENAPEHIKLAVDLIQILEESNIAPATALAALDIVIQDLQRKQQGDAYTNSVI